MREREREKPPSSPCSPGLSLTTSASFPCCRASSAASCSPARFPNLNPWFSLQVKVWFQNRRTKQKKDQGKDSELKSVVSETAATCSVLRLLEQGRLLSPPGLPGLLPPCASSALGSALRAPSLASGTGGGGSAASGPAGGSPHQAAVSSAVGPGHGHGHGPSPAGAGHNLFSLPVPTLLGSVASRLSSTPLAMAGSLAGNLQELSARYLSSSAFEPYTRTASKESAEKKALED